jgi:hypothetical protein
MMGQPSGLQRLFYEFRLEDWIPSDHLLRKIDAVLDLSSLVMSWYLFTAILAVRQSIPS